MIKYSCLNVDGLVTKGKYHRWKAFIIDWRPYEYKIPCSISPTAGWIPCWKVEVETGIGLPYPEEIDNW